MENFRQTLNILKFFDYSVVNMDECALFFRWIGDKSLSQQSTPISKTNEKERLTVICMVNENGTKLPLSIVYKNKKINCSNSSDFYYYQEKSSWVTWKTMIRWSNDIENDCNKKSKCNNKEEIIEIMKLQHLFNE